MGYLDHLESPVTGATLMEFAHVSLQGEMGWEHRTAPATLANVPYAVSPFAGGIAPVKERIWPWKARVLGYHGFDAARDAIARTAGLGVETRLVYITDEGYERVVTATAGRVGAPYDLEKEFYADITVEWLILEHWRERGDAIPGLIYCGQTPTLYCGQTPTLYCGESPSVQTVTLTGTSYSYPTTYTDASIAGPGGIPTQPDTGPILEFHGPMGGSQGFAVQNFAPGLPASCNFAFARPLTATELLIADTGAKSYRIGGVDVSQSVVPFDTQPWDFCIWPGVSNPIGLFWYGTIGTAPTSSTTINVRWKRLYL